LWIRSLELAAIIVGVFFMFVASLGVLRLPDFYSRLHAPTKAATLGLFCLLLAVIIAVPEAVMVTKALLAVVFVAATAPVGAHILARAAYRRGVPRTEATELDEYAEAVRRRENSPGRRAPKPVPDLDPPEADISA
jgi:multicomponent Na+:H+ antiporter subunit G